MSELKICRICLRTEAKGYKYDQYQLKYFYEEVTAVKVNDQDGVPQWFCYECAATLYKFHKFKEKCYVGYELLRELLWKESLTYEAIYRLDLPPELLTYTLAPLLITSRIKSYTATNNDFNEGTKESLQETNAKITAQSSDTDDSDNEFLGKYLKNNRNGSNDNGGTGTRNNDSEDDDTRNKEIEDTLSRYNDSESDNEVLGTYFKNNRDNDKSIVTRNNGNSRNNRNENTGNTHHENNDNEIRNNDSGNTDNEAQSTDNESNGTVSDIMEPFSPKNIIIEDSNKIVEMNSEKIKNVKNRDLDINLKELKRKYLNEVNWKLTDLTEAEALKEFRALADAPKYQRAKHKCGDCFKVFSTEEMRRRHVALRHSESVGSEECRVCRARFKWRSHLRRHVHHHFTKYECRRCGQVFTMENSAILHENYHTGKRKKCLHCNETFKSLTTYYTHLRSHRSSHVCKQCGEAFVSEAGLHQHTRRRHLDDLESPSDDDDTQRYCKKCDITFNGQKAYHEHFFHSDNHTEVQRKDKQDQINISKKILGKRLQEAITRELRKGLPGYESPPPPPKRQKKPKKIPKRKRRIPTTCRHCQLQFSSQRACLAHHVKQHPGTPFFDKTDRHICELCGASLAPGSVSVHMNMHTKSKVHKCDICGRQFTSNVGLKRHMLSHTGEKPYPCPVCSKRFTQSNSMKLHYRTLHLKQPYPERKTPHKPKPRKTDKAKAKAKPKPKTTAKRKQSKTVESTTEEESYHGSNNTDLEADSDHDDLQYLTLD